VTRKNSPTGGPAAGGAVPQRAVRRKVYSQNFLVDRRVIEALVETSGAGKSGLVVDIGAGNGLITEALAARGARVLAVERDPALARRLRARFGVGSGVTIAEADILTMALPDEPFAVVANIPFGITTKILRRLLSEPAGMVRADVIVQAEVARKRAAGGRGTLLNATWEPWFEFSVGARIPAAAFRPRPRVDAAVLIVRCRDEPLLDPALRRDYEAFVTAAFGAARPTVASAVSGMIGRARFAALARELGFAVDALPGHLSADAWAGLFRAVRQSRPARGRASTPAARPPGDQRARGRRGSSPTGRTAS
jgi:23S rRNA (adenine-N6)-dimethyltransferase